MGIAPVNSTVTVTTAGTRVQTSASSALVVSIYFEALGTNTGYIYVGGDDVSATKYITRLSAGAGFGISTDAQGKIGGELQISKFYVDSSVNGDKVQVTYLQRTGSY